MNMRYIPLFALLLLAIISGGSAQYPKGYTHRPLMEFFTSTSCIYCMRDADPAISRLWVEEGNTDEQPWLFVAFHQTNGGAHDDPLVTEESRERYRYYNVLGTPDAIFDGGYIEDSGGGDDCYERYSQDFDDSGARDDQLLGNDFKEVVLHVEQFFDGAGFNINVTVSYPFDSEDKIQGFDGTLYVFMVEDNVWVYSSTLNKTVLQHNVFRGYAIKDQSVSLNPEESEAFSAYWEIPSDVQVPVNPLNVFAVAAVYDNDDTTSQRNGDGAKSRTPRSAQTASPRSTAYDLSRDGPEISDVNVRLKDGRYVVTANVVDQDKIAGAWVFYSLNGTNTSDWRAVEMVLEECDDGDGTCIIYESGEASAEFPVQEGRDINFMIVAYDSNWTESRSVIYNASTFLTMTEPSQSESSGYLPLDTGMMLVAIAIVAVGIYAHKRSS